MATQFESQWRTSREIEKQILNLLSQNAIPDVIVLLDHYRSTCEALILSDYAASNINSVEDRLWGVHIQVNNKYRKALGLLKKEGSKRAVETRKVSKQYEAFLKSSQRFYRTFVHRLSSRFGGIPELERIAHKWTADDGVTELHKSVPCELRHKILLSCHHTLIRLGDLHRYRVTELSGSERNWGPAVGFYTLARIIYPASGVPHNQQAVIALADGDNLRATYHLYRALTVEEPHPGAQGNLEIEFKKILTTWSKGDVKTIALGKETSTSSKALINWFVLLHAKNYRGQEFSQHDELENEVMSQLSIDLKERSIDGMLHKIVLINTAAQYFAGSRLQGDPQSQEVLQSYLFLLRLNVRTFSTLLQVIESDLEGCTIEERAEGITPTNLASKITAVVRRLLPGLRLYSSWFATNRAVLAADVGDADLRNEMKQLWKVYARTLTLLASLFPAEHLSGVGYLLEEDEDTIGFKPLSSDQTNKVWYAEGKIKPRFHDIGVERHHPNMEMLARVRDFLVDGLHLTVDESMPLELHDLQFVYREKDPPAEFAPSQRSNATADPQASAKPHNVKHRGQSDPLAPAEDSHAVERAEPVSLSLSRDIDLTRMVDELVGTGDDLDTTLGQRTEGGSLPPTPPHQVFLDTLPVTGNTYRTGSGPTAPFDPTCIAGNSVQSKTPSPKDMPQSKTASPMTRHQHVSARASLSSIWDPDPSQWSRPGTGQRNSPVMATVLRQGHSRGPSGQYSRDLSLVPDTWRSRRNSPTNRHFPDAPENLGAVGTPSPRQPNLTISPRSTVYGNDSTHDHIMGSSLLFGAGNGPWSMDGGQRSPLNTVYTPTREGV